nr:hypothetical protein BaRGS_031937 [Batillaria attramentaria]
MKGRPFKTSDSFTVAQEPLAEYDVTTDSWHVMLKCGMFSSMEEPTGVTWMTPSGEKRSTVYKGGYLYLQLTNPVAGGKYTCRLPPNSSTTACLPDDSALSRQPSYTVDETKARLTLLEAENRQMKEMLIQNQGNSTVDETKARLTLLEAENRQMKEMLIQNQGNSTVDETKARLALLEANNKQLTDKLGAVVDRIVQYHKTVAFHARLQSDHFSSSYDRVIYRKVLTNVGDAYNPTTGEFTVPYNGTYFLTTTSSDSSSSSSNYGNVEIRVDDSFTVAQEPLAEYDVTTDSWHVMLKCGLFSSMEEPTGVTWMARLTLLEAENENRQMKDKLGAVVDRIVQYHNSFTVAQEPLAEYDVTTDSWHVMLKCGMFSSMEEPTGVTWMTPSGEERSTVYKNGYLYLQLTNPVAGGKYTCRLPPNSSTTACLPDDSALSRQPSYTVDETKARLTLLEAENRQMKEMLIQNQGNSTVDETKARLTLLEANNKQLTDKLGAVVDRIVQYHKTVAFHARLYGKSDFGSSERVIYDKVLTNVGDAYNPTTGEFTVPYNGTYFLTTTSSDYGRSYGDYGNVEMRVDGTWVRVGEERSTVYKDGYLYLQLTNPVAGGKYTCRLPPNSSTTACLPDDSALSRQPSYTVDETKARLTLLEAENRHMKEMLIQNQGNSTVDETKARLALLEANNKQLTDKLGAVVDRIVQYHKTVAFHARLYDKYKFSSYERVIYDKVLTNVGDAYNPTTGEFTVPYNGTYFLTTTSSDDSFTVAQEPLAEYDVTTDSWHVMLKCGMFSSMEEPTGVTWMTPSGEERSTEYKDGYLYLQLTNPVAGGKYTCRLPPNSSTTACLPDDSALSRQPSYTVDETKARLTLLEAENRQMKDLVRSQGDKQDTQRIYNWIGDSDSFTVAQEPLAEYDVTTDSWHLMLKCGMFSSMEEPTGVTWMTPSGEERSTVYKGGYLYLQLTNPVAGGKYTCRLPPNSSTTACLPDDSALSRQPSYTVDETKARLTLLEAENRQMKEMLIQNQGNSTVDETKARLTLLEANNKQLTDKLGAVVDRIVQYHSK